MKSGYVDLDLQIARVNEALTQVGIRLGYRICVKVALAIANKSIPKAPVDTGHLRNSCTVAATHGRGADASAGARVQVKHKVIRSFDKSQEEGASGSVMQYLETRTSPTAVISFIAMYAPFVHEGNPSFNWNDGGPKFLERGANEVIPLIPAIAQAHVLGDKRGPRLESGVKLSRKAGTGEDKPR